MLILLLTVAAPIIGGSILVRRRGSAIVFILTALACILCAAIVQLSSLPHIVRMPTGRLSPTVGMIVGELNVLISMNGLIALAAVYALCRRGGEGSYLDPARSWFATVAGVSLLTALLLPLSCIALLLLTLVIRG